MPSRPVSLLPLVCPSLMPSIQLSLVITLENLVQQGTPAHHCLLWPLSSDFPWHVENVLPGPGPPTRVPSSKENMKCEGRNPKQEPVGSVPWLLLVMATHNFIKHSFCFPALVLLDRTFLKQQSSNYSGKLPTGLGWRALAPHSVQPAPAMPWSRQNPCCHLSSLGAQGRAALSQILPWPFSFGFLSVCPCPMSAVTYYHKLN